MGTMWEFHFSFNEIIIRRIRIRRTTITTTTIIKLTTKIMMIIINHNKYLK